MFYAISCFSRSLNFFFLPLPFLSFSFGHSLFHQHVHFFPIVVTLNSQLYHNLKLNLVDASKCFVHLNALCTQYCAQTPDT